MADESFAVLFPGQGAQFVGMAGDWLQEHPPALRLFERAAGVLGYDLLDICRQGPAAKLATTAVSQPAILVTSLAMLEVLRVQADSPLAGSGEQPATAGLSLGEYTALVHAGMHLKTPSIRLDQKMATTSLDSRDRLEGGPKTDRKR